MATASHAAGWNYGRQSGRCKQWERTGSGRIPALEGFERYRLWVLKKYVSRTSFSARSVAAKFFFSLFG
jgi:hypothetical protein